MKIHHNIIDKPFQYKIIGFIYNSFSEDNLENYIEMHLEKDYKIKRLRFHNPTKLKIEEGFPSATGGMEILDISSNGWENVNIEVGDFESSNGSIKFYAKTVIEVG